MVEIKEREAEKAAEKAQESQKKAVEEQPKVLQHRHVHCKNIFLQENSSLFGGGVNKDPFAICSWQGQGGARLHRYTVRRQALAKQIMIFIRRMLRLDLLGKDAFKGVLTEHGRYIKDFHKDLL